MNNPMESTSFVGVDWGTHSSKWACYLPDEEHYLPILPLYSSDLACNSDSIIFGIEAASDDAGVHALKAVLINDPLGGSFWDSERLDTGTSLGEAVSFSLCCLVADALAQIDEKRGRDRGIDIGFSFPNWLVDKGRRVEAAAKNFREAAAVAIHIAATVNHSELPRPGNEFSIQAWRGLVRAALAQGASNTEAFSIETIMQVSFTAQGGRLRWGFITESGAAGLPYLRAIDIEDVPGAHGLAKLLIVDVGAGSTDIGYMLRVKHRETGKEKLYYFTPASSFPVAGNELTRELMSHYRAMNQPITQTEAEARKLQQTGWHKLAFVDTWRARIAQHVNEYVRGVPDNRWLTLPVPLNIILTGGSGLVPDLKESIKVAVVDALRSREVDSNTLRKISTPGEHLPNLSFGTEAEYARRAVCLGAGDADRPGCTYTAQMDAPTRVRLVTASKWV